MTGEELEALAMKNWPRRVRRGNVFARIMPEQKLRIVNALKANGEIVAMTGDGVNDAPSLKAAHIGIAMGGRGTDVAREASSIVLLDDDFGSVVKAVRLGRRIYDNLRKAIGFIFAVHVPIAGLALLPLIFGLPIIFGPIHIAFLEMVIDPVCSLVFEAETEEDDIMRRPPRAPDRAPVLRRMIGWSVFRAPSPSPWWRRSSSSPWSAACRRRKSARWLSSRWLSHRRADPRQPFVQRLADQGDPAPEPGAGRRAGRRHRDGFALTLLWPVASGLFRFGPLHADDIAVTIGAGVAVLLTLEGMKGLWRARSWSA